MRDLSGSAWQTVSRAVDKIPQSWLVTGAAALGHRFSFMT